MPRLHRPRIWLVLLAATVAVLLSTGLTLLDNADRAGWVVLAAGVGALTALCIGGWFTAFRIHQRTMHTEQLLAATRNTGAAVALRDPLTGLGNYRLFEAALRGAIARAQRYDRPVSIVLIEVGVAPPARAAPRPSTHEQVVKYIATVLVRNVREADTLCRLGDTMFGIVLPETELDGAQRAWERLGAVAYSGWPGARSWSVSGGASAYSVEIDAVEALMAEADRRLALEKRRLRAEPET